MNNVKTKKKLNEKAVTLRDGKYDKTELKFMEY